MMPNDKAIDPGKKPNIPGMPGGAAPKLPGGPDEEKPSLAKVKDLLQQAMDMLALLGAGDAADLGLPVPPPTPAPRAPMAPRKATPSPMM